MRRIRIPLKKSLLRHRRLFSILLLLGVPLFVVGIYLFSQQQFFGQYESLNFLTSVRTLLDDSVRDSAHQRLSAPSSSDAHRQKVAVVSVLDRMEQLPEFQFALSTVHCYCQRHNANCSHIVLFSPAKAKTENNQNSSNSTFVKLLEGNDGCELIEDFMFRRHCVVANWMRTHPTYGWLLFLDADIGVVNPKHRIGEFIPSADQKTELILLDRMFNFEMMAGSYLAKNTQFAREFLLCWANYFHRLPKSFHGTDNGAIHRYSATVSKNVCQHLWEQSKSFSDLFLFEACVRFHTNWRLRRGNSFEGGRLSVLPKGRGWVRDSGLTGTQFSRRDFMLHGWKNSTFGRSAFNPWRNPFAGDQHFDELAKCANESFPWRYKPGFFRDIGYVDKLLEGFIRSTENDYNDTLRRLKLGH